MTPESKLELQRDTVTTGDEALFLLQRLTGLPPTLRGLVHLVVAKTLYADRGDLQVSVDAWAGDTPPLTVQLGVDVETARRALRAGVDGFKLLVETHVIRSTDDAAAYELHRLQLNTAWPTWAWQVGADRAALRSAFVSAFRVTDDDGPLVQGVAGNLALYVLRLSDGEVVVDAAHPDWPRWLRNAAELVRKGATPRNIRDLLWRFVHDDDRWRLRLAEADADEVMVSAYEILMDARTYRRPVPKYKKIGPSRHPRGVGFTPPRRRKP